MGQFIETDYRRRLESIPDLNINVLWTPVLRLTKNDMEREYAYSEKVWTNFYLSDLVTKNDAVSSVVDLNHQESVHELQKNIDSVQRRLLQDMLRLPGYGFGQDSQRP